MDYVIASSRKDRKKYLTFIKGKDGNTAVPKALEGAAMDVGILKVAKLNPLASVGTRITPEANG